MSTAHRLTLLTRLGFAARGLLYITIAFLVIAAERAADPAAALAYLGHGFGRLLLIVMAAGFAAYGLWRTTDGLLNLEQHTHDRRGIGQRIGAVGSGLVHLLLASQAVRLAVHTGKVDPLTGAQGGAATALSLPGGALMLLAAGLVLLGAGAAQLGTAATCRFCDDLDTSVAERGWVRWTGRIGYAARGVVFIISGFFLVSAGWETRASEAGGVEEALAWLDSPWDTIVGTGLLMFGLFSFIEARFRTIHEVPVGEAVEKVRDTLQPG